MLILLENRPSMPNCRNGFPVRRDTNFVLAIDGGRESRDVISWPGLPFSDESEICPVFNFQMRVISLT